MKKILAFVIFWLIFGVLPVAALENDYVGLWDNDGVPVPDAIVFVVPAGDADTSQSNPDRVDATDEGGGTYSFADLTAGVYDMWTYRPSASGVKEASSVRLGHYYPIDGTVTTAKVASWAITGDKLSEPIDSCSVLNIEIWEAVADTVFARGAGFDSVNAIYVLKVPVIAGDPLYVEVGDIWFNSVLVRLSYYDGIANRRLTHDGP